MTAGSDYIAPRLGGAAEKLAWHVRRSIYERVMARLKPTSKWRVADIGVTKDQSADSNFFEKLYPHTQQVVAVGIEDASFLEDEYLGLTFVNADAKDLPFDDQSFDLAFCSAVIEHVGSRQDQRALVSELARVSRVSVITTPNRFFPLEFHTVTPLLHWLPPRVFRRFLRATGRSFFAREANLNLLSARDMRDIFQDCGVEVEAHHYFLGGVCSHLVYIVFPSPPKAL